MVPDRSQFEKGESLLTHHDDSRTVSNISQQPESHEHPIVVRSTHPLSFLSAWKWEILSWFGSLIFFFAIIGVLWYADGKLLPQLQFGITPNAIIGLLATFAQALLLEPVSSVIGQVKWLLLLQERPIDDIRAVDAASRGAYGGLQLILARKGGWIGSFGAAIAIVALAMHTFFQEALYYDPFFTNSTDPTDATIPTARYINGSGSAYSKDSGFVSGVDPELEPAPYIALYSPVGTNFTATAHCSSGNCTWDSYETLGLCNACQDVTNLLTATGTDDDDDNTNYSLPNGFYLGETNVNFALLNVTTSLDWGTVAFSNNGSELFSVLAIGSPPGTIPIQSGLGSSPQSLPAVQPIATECLLQFCIRTMRASFVNGTLRETIISNWTDESQFPDNDLGTNSIVLRSPQTRTEFTVKSDAVEGLRLWLRSLVVGEVTVGYESNANNPVFSTLILEFIYDAMNTSSRGLQDKMDNIANSLSLNFRTIKYQPPPQTGTAFAPNRRAVVVWEWLILPIFELFGSLVLLVAVMLETRRRGMTPWGNSALAYVFHGLDKPPSDRRDTETQGDMKKRARDLLVQFQPRDDGGHLVVASHLSE